MSRRILFYPAALLLFAATACKTAPAVSVETPDESAPSAQPVTADEAQVPTEQPVRFEAVAVSTPEGVEEHRTLIARDDLEARWIDCAPGLGVAIGLEGARQPVGRLLLHDQHLYIVSLDDENNTQIAGYELVLDEGTCRIDARPDFADGGILALGSGSIDVDLFGDLLVSTGTQTRVFDAHGVALEGVCEHLPSLTRLRGAGPHGVARRSGDNLHRATIDRSTCAISPLPKLAGEETLGMHLALSPSQNLYATLHMGSVANALGYFEEGRLAWRYFAGNDTVTERMNLVSGFSVLGEDLLLIRSLPRILQVISPKAERRLELDLNSDEGLPKLSYPYAAASLDANRALVAFRNHEPESEAVTASLRLLTLSAKK